MEKLKGPIITAPEFHQYKYIGDLIYYEGPYLSVYQDGERTVIWDWVDKDTECHRWLIFETSKKDLHDYIKGKISQTDLMKKGRGHICCDMLPSAIVRQAISVRIEDLPSDYLPQEDTRHHESLTGDTDRIIQYIEATP